MSGAPIDLNVKSNEELDNLISNHERRGAIRAPLFLAALAERERRRPGGLDFDRSKAAIVEAAKARRFISYKDLADHSGAEWSKVHYAMNDHLGRLITWSYGQFGVLFSAVVVNHASRETGDMDDATLAGFVRAAKWLGIEPGSDHHAFLKEQQKRVFDWAQDQDP